MYLRRDNDYDTKDLKKSMVIENHAFGSGKNTVFGYTRIH